MKINGSIKGFTLCVPEAGHFVCAHTASTSCALPSQPEATFDFSALGLVALSFTVLPLAGSLPFWVCQLSYSLSSIAFLAMVAAGFLAFFRISFTATANLGFLAVPVKGQVVLGLCCLLGTFLLACC